MEWNEKSAQNILRKHKSRFSLRLTFKVIRILVALLLVFSLYKFIVEISYDSSDVGPRTELYQKLAIDWTYPGLSSDVGLNADKEITSFLTQKITFPLERRIGKNDYQVAQLNLNKPVFSSFTVDITQHYRFNAADEVFQFNLPYNPRSGKKLSGNTDTTAWSTLEKIHEGNVADLAFSTKEYHSPKEIIELLSSYDLDVLWMPLYMGEMQKFDVGWGGGDGTMSITPQWGLSGARLISDDYDGGSLVTSLSHDSVKESQDAMLQNMKTMLQEEKRLAEKILNTDHLQERYDYVNEQGFQAYGAIVTGPIKELLKLRELDDIHSVSLGEIVPWNWDAY